MENMRKFLIEKHGYTEYEAIVTVEDLAHIDEGCKEKLEDYLNGIDISMYSFREFSVESLINEHGLNVISALLSISALKTDYDNFSRMLKKGKK